MSAKIDFKKQLSTLYNAPKKFVIVDVPDMNFLIVEGKGDPNTSQAYRQALEALYSVAYTLKFTIKKEHGLDYAVMPLEGLWWVPDMELFSADSKGDWYWRAMIMQPEFVSTAAVERACAEAAHKKNLPALPKLRFESFHEGLAAQILYLGAYADESDTIQRLHHFIEDNHCDRTGKHHEIYLSDPQRTAPEKLKTIIRQPMKKL